MKTRSLPQRLRTLTIGFFVACIGIAAALLYGLHSLQRQSAAVAQAAVASMDEAAHLLGQLGADQGLLQTLLRQRDPDQIEAGLKRLRDAQDQTQQRLAALKDGGTLAGCYHALVQARETVLAPLLLGNNGAAYEAYLTAYAPKHEAAVAELDRYSARLQDQTTATLTAFAQDTNRKILWATVVIGLVLAGIGGVAWRLTRVIRTSLDSVVRELSVACDSLSSGATQVAASGQSVARGASDQAASLEQASASLEEMTAMTRRNVANAQHAKELALQTQGAAEEGTQDTRLMTAAMQDLQRASAEIKKIIKVIDEIAFQTNLLALNAAVEAARAGEAGMGFAVVADEVRTLAQRAAQAARETAEKIEASVNQTERGVAVSQKVAQGLEAILARAKQVAELVAAITTASEEQNQGITQLNTAVGHMEKVTQGNAAAAEESASAAEELSAQTRVVQAAVAELQALVGSSVTRTQEGEAGSSAAVPTDGHESFSAPSTTQTVPEPNEARRPRRVAMRGTVPKVEIAAMEESKSA